MKMAPIWIPFEFLLSSSKESSSEACVRFVRTVCDHGRNGLPCFDSLRFTHGQQVSVEIRTPARLPCHCIIDIEDTISWHNKAKKGKDHWKHWAFLNITSYHDVIIRYYEYMNKFAQHSNPWSISPLVMICRKSRRWWSITGCIWWGQVTEDKKRQPGISCCLTIFEQRDLHKSVAVITSHCWWNVSLPGLGLLTSWPSMSKQNVCSMRINPAVQNEVPGYI